MAQDNPAGNFSPYFSDIPFYTLNPEKLYLLFDKTGAVIHVWNPANSLMAYILPVLSKFGNNIFNVFEICRFLNSPHKDIERTGNMGTTTIPNYF